MGRTAHVPAGTRPPAREAAVTETAGQGEEQPYHLWNIPSELGPSATAACGNGLCEVGENSENCGLDCIGPAYEYGASIIVSQ